uniref:LexA family protein n=1 Tax=Halomonas sp. TaxID=1486246 RepID=UPI002617928E|nr:translesion error-prone DNA polymerase V autoproteolytic subunit [Halomonas sp.]
MALYFEVLGRVSESAPLTKLPLAAGEVRAGFPSPADDYLEGELDLISHLIPHPSATFYLRSRGDSMAGLGIYDGDLLIVDRSIDHKVGHVLIMAIDGELTCKQLGKIGNREYLFSANAEYPPLPLRGHDCNVWGVVTHNIHPHPPGTV